MVLITRKLSLFFKTFTLLFFVSQSFSKEGLGDTKIISEDLNSISSRNSITLAKLADLEKRINSLHKKLALDQSEPIPNKRIIDTPENDESISTPEVNPEMTDFENSDKVNNDFPLPEPTPSSKTFNYYFTFIFDINFPSNSKLKTLSGAANLDNEIGIGFKTEIGRRLDWLKLGLGLEYEKHDLSNLRIGTHSLGGKGENSSFKFVFKPGTVFDINEIISVSGGIDLGLVGRKADYSVPSVPYLDTGDSIAFIWGIGLSVSANLNDRHSISLGYAFSDFPNADNFSDFVMHSLEASYSLSF